MSEPFSIKAAIAAATKPYASRDVLALNVRMLVAECRRLQAELARENATWQEFSDRVAAERDAAMAEAEALANATVMLTSDRRIVMAPSPDPEADKLVDGLLRKARKR